MADYFEWFPVNDELDSIEFKGNGDFNLISYSGTGSNILTPLTKKIPFEKGEKYLNPDIGMRSIVINLRLFAESVTEINALKDELYKKLQVEPVYIGEAKTGILRFYREGEEEVEIECIPIQSPSFSNVTRKGNVVDVDIEFLCPLPFWRKIAKREIDFEMVDVPALFEPTLEFPLEFISADIIETINNDSEVPVPVRFEIYGEVDGIRLINNTTGEILEIIGLILEGQYVEVYTGFGEKSVFLYDIATGERENIFDWITLAFSDFWKLQPGNNDIVISFDSISGGNVLMFWEERKVGV